MANLTTTEKSILEKAFQMESGYVLNFTNQSFEEFFKNDLNIRIYSIKYDYESGSKANLMRGFWLKESDKIVGSSILKLVEYIETEILIGNLSEYTSIKLLEVAKKIGIKLLGEDVKPIDALSKASFSNGNINISLQNDIFDHVQKLLKDEHYYNAVEESYKIVRRKLKEITGEEKATSAFSDNNTKVIFGHEATNAAERDFFEGVKFLHMAIQFLRNEKAHTPAKNMNKNLAIHYISLASLAYDLINRKNT